MKSAFLALIFSLFLNGILYGQPENEIVAVVNGKKITQKEIDDSIIGQIAPLLEQISILRKAALDNYILKTILEQEAAKRGVSVGELRRILTETKTSVPQSEVEKEYLENVSAFAQMSPDEAKERIRLDMETHARMRYYRAELEKLRSRSKVDLLVTYVKHKRIDVDTGGPATGARNAKVTVVMFSDFQCPYCRQSFGTVKRILENYGESVKLVYKHLPLDIHSDAFPAARASVCADRQGKFWEYHDALFSSDNLSENNLLNIAKKLALDQTEFKTCLNAESSRLEVVKDLQEAKRLKIDGTPAFYINGIQVNGAIPFEKFSQIVKEEIEPPK